MSGYFLDTKNQESDKNKIAMAKMPKLSINQWVSSTSLNSLFRRSYPAIDESPMLQIPEEMKIKTQMSCQKTSKTKDE